MCLSRKIYLCLFSLIFNPALFLYSSRVRHHSIHLVTCLAYPTPVFAHSCWGWTRLHWTWPLCSSQDPHKWKVTQGASSPHPCFLPQVPPQLRKRLTPRHHQVTLKRCECDMLICVYIWYQVKNKGIKWNLYVSCCSLEGVETYFPSLKLKKQFAYVCLNCGLPTFALIVVCLRLPSLWLAYVCLNSSLPGVY